MELIELARKTTAAFLSASLAAASLPLFAPAAYAAVPQYLNYQGKLGDSSGNPLTGSYSFRFRLCASATADCSSSPVQLFSEDWSGANAQGVVNGIYSVQIGSVAAAGNGEGIPASAFDATAYLDVWVQAGTVIDAGAANLLPRERLTAAGQAVHALAAEKLGVGVNVATFTSAGVMLFPGNVGIGTTSPAAKLHMSSGTLLVDGTAGNIKIIDGTQGAGKVLTSDANGLASWQAASVGGETNTFTSSKTFTNSDFSVGGSTFVVTGGNVGVGITSPTLGKLMVFNNTDVTNTFFRVAKNDGGSAEGVIVNDDRGFAGVNSGKSFVVRTRNDGLNDTGAIASYETIGGSVINALWVGINGNVGIGTAIPATRLDVNGVITATGGDSTAWNTAAGNALKWDGGATDLVAATGRTSLGLGNVANAAQVQLQGSTPGTQQTGNVNISGTAIVGGSIVGTGGTASASLRVPGLSADYLDGLDSSAFGDATAANQTTILGRIGTSADAASATPGTLFSAEKFIISKVQSAYTAAVTMTGIGSAPACPGGWTEIVAQTAAGTFQSITSINTTSIAPLTGCTSDNIASASPVLTIMPVCTALNHHLPSNNGGTTNCDASSVGSNHFMLKNPSNVLSSCTSTTYSIVSGINLTAYTQFYRVCGLPR